jgi:hypothetical protein
MIQNVKQEIANMKFVTFKYVVDGGNKKFKHKACLPASQIKEVRLRAGSVSVYVQGYDTPFYLTGWFAFYRLARQLKSVK